MYLKIAHEAKAASGAQELNKEFLHYVNRKH